MARKTPEIPSASLADIAFMLLIFFLVTTTMDTDIGLSRQLPPIPDEDVEPEDQKINKRNVFIVLINKNDQLLVNNNYMDVNVLREKTKEFVANPTNKANLSEKESLSDLKLKALEENKLKAAQNFQDAIDAVGNYNRSKGVVSLQNDRGTSYKMYIEVQNELVAAFNELKNELCMEKYGKKFTDLDTKDPEDKEIAKIIKTVIPLAISEAEPRNTR